MHMPIWMVLILMPAINATKKEKRNFSCVFLSIWTKYEKWDAMRSRPRPRNKYHWRNGKHERTEQKNNKSCSASRWTADGADGTHKQAHVVLVMYAQTQKKKSSPLELELLRLIGISLAGFPVTLIYYYYFYSQHCSVRRHRAHTNADFFFVLFYV